MPNYFVVIAGSFMIEAENVMQAKNVAKKMRVIPSQLSGSKRMPKNRDSVTYSIMPIAGTTVTVERLKTSDVELLTKTRPRGIKGYDNR